MLAFKKRRCVFGAFNLIPLTHCTFDMFETQMLQMLNDPDAHAILLNDGQIWLIKLIEFLVEPYDAGLIQLGAVGRDKIPDAIGVAQTKNAV